MGRLPGAGGDNKNSAYRVPRRLGEDGKTRASLTSEHRRTFSDRLPVKAFLSASWIAL